MDKILTTLWFDSRTVTITFIRTTLILLSKEVHTINVSLRVLTVNAVLYARGHILCFEQIMTVQWRHLSSWRHYWSLDLNVEEMWFHQYYKFRLNHGSDTDYLAYFLKIIVNVHIYVNMCLTTLVLWLTNNSLFTKFKFLLSCVSKRV